VIIITVFLPNGPGVINDIGNVTHAALIANARVSIEAERVEGEIERKFAPDNGKEVIDAPSSPRAAPKAGVKS
jgi:hypothetical protein